MFCKNKSNILMIIWCIFLSGVEKLIFGTISRKNLQALQRSVSNNNMLFLAVVSHSIKFSE